MKQQLYNAIKIGLGIMLFISWQSKGFSQNTASFNWAKQFGGTGSTVVETWGIVTDPLGNVFTAGLYGGTIDFDPGTGTYTLPASGNYTIFISKLDANGNFLWVRFKVRTLSQPALLPRI